MVQVVEQPSWATVLASSHASSISISMKDNTRKELGSLVNIESSTVEKKNK